MKIYLSGQWSRRDEIEGYAALLREDGHEVVSTWHAGINDLPDENEEVWWEYALDDIERVLDAETFVAFTEPVGTLTRGGRLVEWGYAYAQPTIEPLIVVGPLESAFFTLADERFDNIEGLRAWLAT